MFTFLHRNIELVWSIKKPATKLYKFMTSWIKEALYRQFGPLLRQQRHLLSSESGVVVSHVKG